MHIKLLGMPSYQPAITAWQNSRDNAPVKQHDIVGIDAPVNEMPTALLHFENFTILEREIFTTPRNHVIWARTSRVDDPIRFVVPMEFYSVKIHETMRVKMADAKEAGISQDELRMNLPLVSMTSWTARMSFRDMVKMAKYFDYLCDFVAMGLRERFRSICLELENIIKTCFFVFKLKHESVLRDIKLVKYLNEEPFAVSNEGTSARMGVYHSLTMAHMPIALRAQLVRHREIAFNDDFIDCLLRNDFAELTIGDTVRFTAMAKESYWKSILGKRTCWIAQADLWRPVTELFDSIDALPCADGCCPYSIDAALRLTDADPGAPCPRYCNLNGIAKTPAMIDDMNKEAVKRGNSRELWKMEIIK